MPAKDDPLFASFLLSHGNGQLQDEEHDFINWPPSISLLSTESSITADQLFTDLFLRDGNEAITCATFKNRAILTARNDKVDIINSAFIEKFEGGSVCYKSFDSLLDDGCNLYPIEFLHTLTPGGMSPHELHLKKTAR